MSANNDGNWGTGQLPAHTTLQNGRYFIVEQVGIGGMGAVYKAMDTRWQPHPCVAIKEMSQARLSGEELERAKERFRSEANMLRHLNHVNLPHVYDSFEENGRSYLVMEFIEGENLLRLLQASPNEQLPLETFWSYACQLCDVLDYLHRQSPPIIFRDLKPANIMVRPDGHLFLIDFGIARLFKPGQQNDTEALGSRAYASPQQLDQQQTNVHSDLYSLGVTLHQCLTGRVPTPVYIPAHTFPSVCSFNPTVPVELDQLILQLMAYEVSNRPQSATEVKAALLAIQQAHKNGTNGEPGLLLQKQTLALISSALPIARRSLRWLGGPVLKSLREKSVSTSQALLAGSSAFGKRAGEFLKIAAHKTRDGIFIANKYIRLEVPKIQSPKPPGISIKLIFLLPVFYLMFIMGGDIYLFQTPSVSYPVVEFCLALLLLFFTGIVSTKMKNSEPKSILTAIALLMVITCLVLSTQADVQQFLYAVTFSLFDAITTLYQLAIAALVVAMIFLFFRLAQSSTWTVRTGLFVAAVVMSSLQVAFWFGDEWQITSLLPADVEPRLNAGMISSFRVLTFLLLGIVALGLVRAAIILSQHLLKQIPAQKLSYVQVNRFALADSATPAHVIYPDVDPKKMMTRIDRLVVFAIPLTALPLQWFFGERIPPLAWTIYIPTAQYNMPLNWILILLLIVSTFLALLRLFRPIGRSLTLMDGLIVLVSALLYMAFFFADPRVQLLFPLSLNIHEGISQWFPGDLSSYVLIAGITITSLVSWLWLYRPYFDRTNQAYITRNKDVHAVLYAAFGLTIICDLASAACLVLLALPHLPQVEILRHGVPFLLVFALTLLILGTVIAVWAESSYKRSPQAGP